MVVILGGGLAGLSAGFYLSQKFVTKPVFILEASNRVGGWIKTNTTKTGQIFEQGPRTIRPVGEQGANTLQLINDIGLADRVKPILSSSSSAKNRMIYVDGKLHLLPRSLMSLFRKTPPFSSPIIVSVLKGLFTNSQKCDDESMYSFVERHFGAELANYAVSPLICGICAGDAKEISVKFLLKAAFEGEQKHGNLARYIVANTLAKKPNSPNENALVKKAKDERWSMYTLDGGLETLTKQLQHNLNERNNVKIQLNSPCSKANFSDSSVHLVCNNEENLLTDHIISTLLPAKLADLIDVQHPKLAKLLREIPSVTVAVVNLYFDSPQPLDAFGFLVPPSQNLPILGVIYDSCCYNVSDKCTMLTVMMGGRWFDKYFKDKSETMILETAREYVGKILGISEAPSEFKVNILTDCIPQYNVGHFGRIDKIQDYITSNNLRLSLCGSAYGGVGINDVILHAKKVVDKM